MSKTDGYFKDWVFDRHIATKGEYSVWHCNGFLFFRDNGAPLLEKLPIVLRYRLWREFKKEVRRRGGL